MNKVKFGLAADHAGFETKTLIIEMLKEMGYETIDYGCNTTESVDYPTFAHALATGIESGECQLGFAFCGSANGISMTLNKHQSIRAAICWTPEIAQLAKQHNDANICSIPARFVTAEEAKAIAKAYIATEFEGGRHQRRVDMIPICK